MNNSTKIANKMFLVKSTVSNPNLNLFLDFIFLMQVSFGNEKSFGKWVKTRLVYQIFFFDLD